MIMFVCLAIASVLLAVFAVLFLSADGRIGSLLLASLCDNETEQIKTYKHELTLIAERVRSAGSAQGAMKREPDPTLIKRGKKLKKKLEESEKRLAGYEKNGIGLLDMVPAAGYRMMQLVNLDASTGFVNRLYNLCLQFKEKREAMNHAYYLVACLIGNLMLGACMLFLGLGLGLAMGMGAKSFVIGVVLFAVFGLLGYVPYDAVSAQIKTRAASIERDFPRVVSKLTLLTVSGMEVNQAWNLVAASDTGVLYVEMSRVITDIQHNISPVEAYTRFIKRCNNSYTTKLATAIMQNLSKGNSEIVKLLRDLNNESWSEYKHNARRMGEKISSKMMIPTMLLFAGILILIIVPVVGGFNF